jgi:zinc transport system substrate-binding protein
MKSAPRAFPFAAPTAALLAVALCLYAGAASAAPLSVFVSVLPLQTFVERIGGDRVDTHLMVPPGQSPHTFDPSPKQIAALAKADLYLRVGVPFEDAWMGRIRAAGPDMQVVDLREGLPLREIEAHHHGEESEHASHRHDDHDHEHDAAGKELDPHLWTSPRLVRAMSLRIRDTLAALDPAGATTFAENQAALDAELAALDSELETALRDLRHRRFLVYHPAWGYFADAYDLTQVPIELEGKEPGARRLGELIDQARGAGIRLVLVQPQFDKRAAERLAKAIGGRVEAVDPLAADYAGTLRRLADLLRSADAGDASASAAER